MRALAAAGAAAALVGCAPGTAPAPEALLGPAPVRSRLAPGQTGLEVRTWQVSDEGDRVQQALRDFTAPAVGRSDELALRRNGFVLVPVAADRVDDLRAALGGSAMDVRTWLGTATAWQEIVSAPVGSTLVEVDGVARERPGARLRLMARAWPLPMEDGTRINVSLVPQFAPERREANLARNGDRLVGDLVRSCLMDVELERGVAWALTCDPGGFVETDAEAPGRARDAETVAGPPAPGAEQASGKIGARVSTVGAGLLLASPARARAPSRRTVLVLVPHLGASPFPAPAAAPASAADPAQPIEPQ
jgi:hypothetical protein